VGDILLELGALDRIDADTVVHELMGPGSEVTAQVAEAFGPGTVTPDGSVDRQALGLIVFADHSALRRLESITHPAVRREIRRRIDTQEDPDGVVVVDAVKLLQSDLLPLVDTVWVVACDGAEEMRRLTEERKMSPDDAAARLRAQPRFDHPVVSRVIENNQSLMMLRHNVTEAWSELSRLRNEH
jgi:dephospho-CoA kinase